MAIAAGSECLVGGRTHRALDVCGTSGDRECGSLHAEATQAFPCAKTLALANDARGGASDPAEIADTARPGDARREGRDARGIARGTRAHTGVHRGNSRTGFERVSVATSVFGMFERV